MLAFGLARLLEREGVDRLLRGRPARADAALSDPGSARCCSPRLVPVLPFTTINYGAGVTGVSFAAYVAGSAVGMIPGTIAYATLGAVGDTDPRVTGAAVATLVLLSVGGGGSPRAPVLPDGTRCSPPHFRGRTPSTRTCPARPR